MISFKQKGDFSKLNRFLERAKEVANVGFLDKYGKRGVEALASATPVGETGTTADSWYYKINRKRGSVSLDFYNSNSNDGVLIAIVLQYGHANWRGGFVEGEDFINPAIKPIFDEIVSEVRREVANL